VRTPGEDELDGWMSRLAEGDRNAFDPLFQALYPRAARLARAKLPEDQAADAAQSVMMKVFARATEFNAGSAVLPWFYAVAANEIHTQNRRRAKSERRAVSEARAERVAAPDDPERLLLECELRACLDRAIAALDDASADAIRSMLDEVPSASRNPAFRKRVSRAYARLRLLLGGPDE
jgi:RNA polymerase sigma-70 factor (ECF subfamily)